MMGGELRERAEPPAKMANEFQSLYVSEGVAKLVSWLACLCFYNGVFREAFIDKTPKNV